MKGRDDTRSGPTLNERFKRWSGGDVPADSGGISTPTAPASSATGTTSDTKEVK